MATYPIITSQPINNKLRQSIEQTISTTSKPRVDTETECSFPFLTVTAPAIGNVEGYDYSVALFQQRYPVSKTLDDTQVFVTYRFAISS